MIFDSLLGMFSVVSVLYHKHACAKGRTPKPPTYPWYAKAEITFSDALATVRRLFWAETVFSEALPHGDLNKLPPKLREMLFDHLATAA